MQTAKLKLANIQDIAHRRFQSVVNQFNIKSILASYDDTSIIYYVEETSDVHRMLEKMYHTVNDYDNISFRVFGETNPGLPDTVFLCYRNGEWFYDTRMAGQGDGCGDNAPA